MIEPTPIDHAAELHKSADYLETHYPEISGQLMAAAEEIKRLKSTADLIGQCKFRPPQKMSVTAVATVPGWVFVMPQKAGRTFSIAYGVWVGLEDASPSDRPPTP